MPLTDDESTQVYLEVASDLRGRDLGWIVDEVEATIAVGKGRTIKVNRRKKLSSQSAQLSLDLDPARHQLVAKSDEQGSDELTADDYTPRERLQLLLECLIQYVLDMDDLASNLANIQIRTNTEVDVRSVVFVSESGEERIAIGLNMTRPNVSLVEELRGILARL